MANLKSIRNRINSVRSTRQITSAMKMVAAAKLRRSQDRIVALRPYTAKLMEILGGLSQSLAETGVPNPYSVKRAEEKLLMVVFTSNRGLCGAFNANIIREVRRLVNYDFSEQFSRGDLSFFAVGKKGFDFLRKLEGCDVTDYSSLLDSQSFEIISDLAAEIMKDFENARYDRVVLVYNQFKNAAVQTLTIEDFLPVEISPEVSGVTTVSDYIYEPGRAEVVSELIPKSLRLQFYKALLDSSTAEHGARMTSMHLATDNATELIQDLTLQYNKARQSTITNQILEVVSGAEALKYS